MNKQELRKAFRNKRRLIDNKAAKDLLIYNKLVNSEVFKKAETILCYLSLSDEVSTDRIINYALENNKRVAVPYCIDNMGNMEFYLINSLSELHIGSFGVREPDIKICNKLNDFAGSIIIVPAMCYDKNGFRLGYGKGYYDRFLENYPFISIGLCYNSLIVNKLITDKYDKSVDIIISEEEIIYCKDGGKNG